MQRSISTTSVTYATDSAMDSELSSMLGSLSLRGWTEAPPQGKQEVIQQAPPHVESSALSRSSSGSQPNSDDSMMMEVTDAQGNIQFIEQEETLPGCGLLHVMQAHYTPTSCGTKDADFNLLEVILTHREAFVAFPYGHRTCSKALTKIAFELEHRAQQNSGDGDLDTAIALHNEAWLMSGWYST